MNYAPHIVNPFYASRLKRVAPQKEERDRPVYARLPLAPRNASPVPHLTSLYHFHRAGEYGDRKWPGNCGGNLIKDLLMGPIEKREPVSIVKAAPVRVPAGCSQGPRAQRTFLAGVIFAPVKCMFRDVA